MRQNGIRAWFHRIGPRIAICYFLVALFTILTTIAVYQRISMDYGREQVNTAANQTIATVKVNVEQMITTANNYSKMIFSNSHLQTLLRSGNVNSDLPLQSRVNTFLFNLMEAVPIIDSVYIFDFSGNYFLSSSGQPGEFTCGRVEDAPWYSQVMDNRGLFHLSLNGDGAFTNPGKGTFVTLVRLIRDVNYTNNLGIMALNIPESAFSDIYASSISENSMSIAVFDDQCRSVIRFDGCSEEKERFLQSCASNNYEGDRPNLVMFSGEEYLITQTRNALYGWTFMGMTPTGSVSMENRSNILTVTFLFVLSGIVFLLASILIFRMFTKPINRLIKTMNAAQEGSYNEIAASESSLEFELLYENYNKMMQRMKMMHERHMEEQDTIRKAELNVLQAQINPHFLYNTLDSIVALAMMNDNAKVIQISEALAGYYRLSVSKGREVISLREDLQILKNYMIIQQIRYQDMYKIHYDVDEACLDNRIPKLVLQPLVENALYHGLRAKGERGNILVRIHDVDGKVEILICDDGVGMSPERIQEILTEERRGDIASFGLWGTLERIRIYYGDESRSSVESTLGEGTTIRLIIPEVHT